MHDQHINEDEQLNKILECPDKQCSPSNASPQDAKTGISGSGQPSQEVEFRQWQIGPNDTFRPAGLTRNFIPPGVYQFDYDGNGALFVRHVKVVTDSLLHLPDSAGQRVISSMEMFWKMEDRYRNYGLLYKRGILLWGPPGSGKTCVLALLSQQLIQNGGIVILCTVPYITSYGLSTLRRIEPNRRIICIMEDIDEIIVRHSEHDLLALLDGESQVDNICNIATTNYPERLGARIVNRPSRFDERIFVGMPSAQAREVYLRRIASTLDELSLRQWINDTEGLSIAHLRELAAAVLCLDQPYDAVLSRLRSMRQRPHEKSGFAEQQLGFVKT